MNFKEKYRIFLTQRGLPVLHQEPGRARFTKIPDSAEKRGAGFSRDPPTKQRHPSKRHTASQSKEVIPRKRRYQQPETRFAGNGRIARNAEWNQEETEKTPPVDRTQALSGSKSVGRQQYPYERSDPDRPEPDLHRLRRMPRNHHQIPDQSPPKENPSPVQASQIAKNRPHQELQ